MLLFAIIASLLLVALLIAAAAWLLLHGRGKADPKILLEPRGEPLRIPARAALMNKPRAEVAQMAITMLQNGEMKPRNVTVAQAVEILKRQIESGHFV